MDAKHFDAWTRRKFGLAAGSAVAALVAFRHADDAGARKRCKRLGRTCAFDVSLQQDLQEVAPRRVGHDVEDVRHGARVGVGAGLPQGNSGLWK